MQSFRINLLAYLFMLPVFSGFSANAQTKWSLEASIRHALQNNLQIRQGHLNVGLAHENLTGARASQLPSLNANATHGINTGRTIDPFTNTFATENVRTNNFSLSTGLTLFSGFQVRNSIEQSKHDLDASRYDVEKMENDVTLSVTSAYLQILLARELVEVAARNLDITRLQIERTSRLVEAGTLARGSLLTIEAQAATDELQLINAQNQLEFAYLNLAQLLRLEDHQNFEIEIPEIDISAIGIIDYSPMQIFNASVENQPEVQAAGFREASAERGVRIALGARSPILSLRASYGTGYSGASREIIDVVTSQQVIGVTASGENVFGPSLDFTTRIKPFRSQIEDNLNRSVALVLTIPILNNWQVNNNINRSQIALENARVTKQIVRDQFFMNIQQAYADARAALKRYNSTSKNVVALEEAFRYTTQKFNLGMVNSLEFNDSRNRLSTAQSDLVQAKYEYVFRVKMLNYFMGEPISF
ncbi:MAG TPA: TolC family protein [Bacteroidales bacterium]|nr:TolC family protein [Bacteroidales bacterium]